MSLPYEWRPIGTRYGSEPIKVGDLIPHEHQVWRVVDIRPLPADRWTDEDRDAVAQAVSYRPSYRDEYLAKITPRVMELHPIDAGDDVRARDKAKHYLLGGRARWHHWPVYENEHYPICAQCHEPLPCRDQMAEKVSTKAADDMSRYEIPSVCPVCREPITHRQKRVTFPDNVMIPAGPPVSFHERRQCHYGAVQYEKRWVAADPERRRARFSCVGHVTNHNDGTYSCTEMHECPGPRAHHPSYSVCACPDCHARGSFGCHPSASARNVALDGA